MKLVNVYSSGNRGFHTLLYLDIYLSLQIRHSRARQKFRQIRNLVVRPYLTRTPYHNFDAERPHSLSNNNSTSQEVTCMTVKTTGTLF